jgi:hypothetical protein
MEIEDLISDVEVDGDLKSIDEMIDDMHDA